MSKKQCEAENRRGEPCNASANGNGFCFTRTTLHADVKERLHGTGGGLRRITPSIADKSLVPKESSRGV